MYCGDTFRRFPSVTCGYSKGIPSGFKNKPYSFESFKKYQASSEDFCKRLILSRLSRLDRKIAL